MDEHQNPSETTEIGKDNLIAAAGELKQADKAQELRGAGRRAASVTRSGAELECLRRRQRSLIRRQTQ
jgi:hypothetical protein